MSFNLATGGKRRFTHAGRSGSAFIVEALFLLVFLTASAAVFTQLFAHAANQATEGLELSRAVAVASDTAEQFAANPESVEAMALEDGLLVTCEVTAEPGGDNGVASGARDINADGAGGSGGEVRTQDESADGRGSGYGIGGGAQDANADGAGGNVGGGGGTLYHATIRVYSEGSLPEAGQLPEGKPIYELQTARYERGDAR